MAANAPASVATLPSGILDAPCEECGRAFLRRTKTQRFCSALCRAAWWDHHHPRLGTIPVVPEGRSIDRIVALCADRRWRTVPEIAHDTGSRELTVARRVQESQSGRKGRRIPRFVWESRYRAGSRTREYQLVLNPEVTR